MQRHTRAPRKWAVLALTAGTVLATAASAQAAFQPNEDWTGNPYYGDDGHAVR